MEVVIRVTVAPNPRAENGHGPIGMDVYPASSTEDGVEEALFTVLADPHRNRIVDADMVAAQILEFFQVWQGPAELWTVVEAEPEA